MADTLIDTPLRALHDRLGGKIVPFAGHALPVQYPMGVMQEHLHCRAQAGLFDVSHMGQVRVSGVGYAEAMERLMPVDVLGLKPGRQRYGLLTNADGGILDDLMFANRGDHIFLVVNAACKEADIAHLKANLPSESVEVLEDRALLALQGPMAEAALGAIGADVAAMRFMDVADADVFGGLLISRSGYTGEDGFEISVRADQAEALAQALLAQDAVAPIGLGARDSLRLEAGLCLYGNDIDAATSPVEAQLKWAIGKARREGPRAGGFPGAERISRELADGPGRLRVGIVPEGRAPMRAGTPLHAAPDGPQIGEITSGSFGPSVGGPVAMGYVPADLAEPGTMVFGAVRGKLLPATVSEMPFQPQTYKR